MVVGEHMVGVRLHGGEVCHACHARERERIPTVERCW